MHAHFIRLRECTKAKEHTKLTGVIRYVAELCAWHALHRFHALHAFCISGTLHALHVQHKK